MPQARPAQAEEANNVYRFGARPPGPYAAIVFDCDGLLINTQDAWDWACAELAAGYGVVLTAEDRHALRGLELQPLGRTLAELLGHPAPADQLSQQVHAAVRAALSTGCPAMPGTHRLITALHGTRPLAVASNAPCEIVTHYLNHAGILDAFEVIIGSDQVDDPKPAPDVYLAACHHLDRPPGGCIAMEDSSTGALAALAAGLYLIAVPSTPGIAFPAHHHATGLDDPLMWRLLGLSPGSLTSPT
jgi:HAD superfamily hydrolase (TIGR01509 family)